MSHMCIYIYIYTHTHIVTYIYMYIYIYTYTHIYTYTSVFAASFGRHYLSNATCLIRPCLFHACFKVSRITIN